MAKGKYLYSIQVMVMKNDVIYYIYITDISRNPKQFIKNAVYFFNSLNCSSGDMSSLGPLYIRFVVHTEVQN